MFFISKELAETCLEKVFASIYSRNNEKKSKDVPSNFSQISHEELSYNTIVSNYLTNTTIEVKTVTSYR